MSYEQESKRAWIQEDGNLPNIALRWLEKVTRILSSGLLLLTDTDVTFARGGCGSDYESLTRWKSAIHHPTTYGPSNEVPALFQHQKPDNFGSSHCQYAACKYHNF